MSDAFVRNSGQMTPSGQGSTNLGDILERVLDRGLVIAGDIRVSLLDIELLTLKLRLVIASVDTAKEMGIDWWEHDRFLTSGPRRDAGSVEGRQANPRQLERDASDSAVGSTAEASDDRPERERRR